MVIHSQIFLEFAEFFMKTIRFFSFKTENATGNFMFYLDIS